MRVLIAPDCFGGTLSAIEAAEAIAAGWRSSAAQDELILRPLADGGPGFVDVLHAALGGTLHRRTVSDPLGRPVTAAWLEHDGTAYVESAQACGLHLVPVAEVLRDTRTRSAVACGKSIARHSLRRDALAASTRGVGEIVVAALAAGVHTVVVGLGGSATTDGGAGLLAALGAPAIDSRGEPLAPGGGPLVDCAGLGTMPELGEVTLVAAADVDNPLLGPHGAARVFGPQKGAVPAAVETLELAMTRWSAVLVAATGRDVRDAPGAGAAGGLGFALLALGASVESGAGMVRRLTGLDRAMDGAGLVVTGEGSFDRQSLRGKLVSSVAAAAACRGLPCVVLAGQVGVDLRNAAEAGIRAVYSVAEHAGSVTASLSDPAGTLAATASRVGTTWAAEQG
jgi:glycerate kinase